MDRDRGTYSGPGARKEGTKELNFLCIQQGIRLVLQFHQ